MKHNMFRIFPLLLLLVLSSNLSADTSTCKFEGPYGIFFTRPQGFNSAALYDPYWHGCNCKDQCFTFSLGYRYTQTTHGKNIAKSLFGKETLNFQGSVVADRSNTSIIAEWLGLDPLYSGSISFNPKIRQSHLDFGVRFKLGEYCDYFKNSWVGVYGTFVHSNWRLDAKIFDETTNNKSSITSFDPGYALYMSAGTTQFSKSLKEVLEGTFTFGDMRTEWKYGKFDLDKNGKSSNKLANLDLIFGYDLFNCENKHATIFFKVGAPTGTKLDRDYAEHIFKPLIGNGHHWEIGGGLDAHWNLWNCNEKCLGIYFTGNISHLCKDKQLRTFDFKKYGPLSRYMLLKELTPPVPVVNWFNVWWSLPINSDYKLDYAGSLENAVNFTTREVKSSFSLQGDLTLQLIYKNCGWTIGAGYNLYGRSEEKLKDFCQFKNNKIFGMKGNTGTHFKLEGGTVDEIWNNNATQTNAAHLSITTVPVNSIEELDNPFPSDPPGSAEITVWDNTTTPSTNIITRSFPPIPLKCEDIDIKPYPKQIIHKFFGHIDYQWDSCYSPYMGIYAEYDMPNNRKCNFTTPTQWGIGIHGGISF